VNEHFFWSIDAAGGFLRILSVAAAAVPLASTRAETKCRSKKSRVSIERTKARAPDDDARYGRHLGPSLTSSL